MTRSEGFLFFMSLAVFGAVALFAADLFAQPCCTATGSSEVSVVGRCHQAVVASQLSYERGTSSWDAAGEHSLREHGTDDVVMTVGAGTRVLTRSLQIHGGIPMRLQHRQGTGTSSTDWGPGDASAQVRWTAVEDPLSGIGASGASWLPFVDLFAGAKFPTGRAPENQRDPMGADVTGDGAWAALGGARVAKFVDLSNVVNLQVDGSYSFAREIPHPLGPRSFGRGLELGYQVGYLHLWNLFWSTGVEVSHRSRGAVQLDGLPVPDSEYRRTRVGGHVTYNLSFPYWELTFAASTDTFLSALGRNVPAAGPTASLTLRRTFM